MIFLRLSLVDGRTRACLASQGCAINFSFAGLEWGPGAVPNFRDFSNCYRGGFTGKIQDDRLDPNFDGPRYTRAFVDYVKYSIL